MKFHQKVGPITIQLCFLFDGWVIGGAVDYLSGITDEKPKDIDIVIPYDKWSQASKLLHNGIANTFGGIKIKDGEFSVDVWMDDVARLFCSNDIHFQAFEPKHNVLLIRYNDD